MNYISNKAVNRERENKLQIYIKNPNVRQRIQTNTRRKHWFFLTLVSGKTFKLQLKI